MLDDARAHAASLITADAALGGCRNTIVVLLVGGGEGTISAQNLATKASTFLNVNARRVPIYVVALFPAASEVAALQAIATNSGGQYFEITEAMVTATTAGDPVPQVVRAVNTAVQHAFVPSTTFNTAPSAAHSLRSHRGMAGDEPDRRHRQPARREQDRLRRGGGGAARQRDLHLHRHDRDSTAVERPRHVGLRAAGIRRAAPRISHLQADRGFDQAVRLSIQQDGSRLWVSSVPAAGSRNIYTVLPGTHDDDPVRRRARGELCRRISASPMPPTLIDYVRALPLGAIVGSTPAFLDIPSLDPPPDADYPAFREANKDRRALIFVGANDGMLHALDARTGDRSVGVHPVQPAAEAACAPLRPVARQFLVLRRQLAQDRRCEGRRRCGARISSSARVRAGRSTTRWTSRCRIWRNR